MTRSLLVVALAFLAGLAANAALGGSSSSVATVRCEQSLTPMNPGIGSNTSGMRLVLGRVWLPKTLGVLRANTPWPHTPANRDAWIKYGVVVTAGSAVTIEVPQSSRAVYALDYKAKAARVADGEAEVHFVPCGRGAGAVTVWAGGYLAKRPVCARLIVHAGDRTARVSFPLGRRC